MRTVKPIALRERADGREVKTKDTLDITLVTWSHKTCLILWVKELYSLELAGKKERESSGDFLCWHKLKTFGTFLHFLVQLRVSFVRLSFALVSILFEPTVKTSRQPVRQNLQVATRINCNPLEGLGKRVWKSEGDECSNGSHECSLPDRMCLLCCCLSIFSFLWLEKGWRFRFSVLSIKERIVKDKYNCICWNSIFTSIFFAYEWTRSLINAHRQERGRERERHLTLEQSKFEKEKKKRKKMHSLPSHFLWDLIWAWNKLLHPKLIFSFLNFFTSRCTSCCLLFPAF